MRLGSGVGQRRGVLLADQLLFCLPPSSPLGGWTGMPPRFSTVSSGALRGLGVPGRNRS